MAKQLIRRAGLHWRSLRLHTLLVVLAVALAPVVYVWGIGQVERTTGLNMRREVIQTVRDLDQTDDRAVQTRIARQAQARVRILDADGQPLLDIDGEIEGPLERMDRLFYRPDEPPTLTDFEATRPPLSARAWLAGVGSDRPRSQCVSNDDLTLLVCESALRTDDGRTILVQQSSRRAIRALYDLRWRVLQLALLVGFIAAWLGGWLALRFVRPLSTLRDAALERAERPLAAEPLGISRDDEFGDLAGAFDTLLAAVRSQSAAHQTFVEDLAHEMKNPVAAIRAAAETLDQSGEVDPERAQRLARVLAQSTDRLQRVLTGLLELARAEAGLPGDDRVEVDLESLTRGVVGALSDAPDNERVRFEVQTDPTRVHGVPERLEDVVRNLLVNAASFAQPDGEVQVQLRAEEDHAVLVITDSGPGIPPEHLERVFDRFFTTRGARAGSGLGLAMVHAVVLAHGGRVAAASPPEGGARMTVHLPLSDP